ncbi:hypothetical protein BC830DRAFT_391931 [Chytriomyces sp. MP71]|nr:hypothetical protein BC830DRAFT_391931 [Chytriomyces sp. MP71]
MATNQGCRSMGFCSDYIQYIAHAGGRLVDQFGDSEFIAKRINCPNSTYLHGEYLTHPLLQNISKKDVDRGRVAQLTKLTPETLPESIPRVRNLWLPNLEQTKKEHLPVIPLFYKILCKTRITCTAIKQYIKNKNVKPSPIFAFMAHSSPDVLQDAETVFGESQLNSLRTATRSFNKFIHTYGKTGTKSTVQVVECWLQHPEWPQLLIVGDKRSLRKELQEKASQARNIVELDYVDIPTLRALQIEHGIAICSSTQEGYGHYINDARSMGSLLLTTNHPPMSEFVNGDGVDGILIEHSGKPFASDYQALSEEFKSAVEMRTGDICASVERVLRLNESERERIGLEGRKSFERDTAFMIEKMAELLEEAWQHLGRDRQSLKGAEYVS